MLGTIGCELAASKCCEKLSLDDRRVRVLRRAESLEAIPGEHYAGAAIEAKASIIVQARDRRCARGSRLVDVHGGHQSYLGRSTAAGASRSNMIQQQ